MKHNVVVYGTGNYCKLLLEGELLEGFQIVHMVDGNPEKWGTTLRGIKIEKPESIFQISFDKVIIAARNYESIAERLIMEMKVSSADILYFDYDRNRLCAIPENMKFQYGTLAEKRLNLVLAKQIVEEGLLLECLNNKEFEGYEQIIVLGDEEQYQMVLNFFSVIGVQTQIYREKDIKENNSRQKYVLTSEQYQEDLKRLEQERGCSAKQCVIVPLFDVIKTLIF